MSERSPQLSYSPDGMLHIQASTVSNPPPVQKQLEKLDAMTGISVDSANGIEVDVRAAFGSEFKLTKPVQNISRFLNTLGRILPSDPDSSGDYVLHTPYLGVGGFNATVYPHFERWLQSPDPLTETVAKETLAAMALPFGLIYESSVQRQFKLRATRQAEASQFSVTIFTDRFSLYSIQSTPAEFVETVGSVDWNWVQLSTLGNCACIGVQSEDRHLINVSETSQTRKRWLYEMKPHNVDSPKRTLSQLLGVGTLAYHATLYDGSEDILAEAQWQEPQIYPKA
jgi:hypothetical protein